MNVPTWNYVVVHVRGRMRILDREGLRVLLDDMVERFEPTGWRLQAPEERLGPLLDAIAGFEIVIEEIRGKWKLSQNRSPEDRARVASWLAQGDGVDRTLAEAMGSGSGRTK